MSFWKSILPVAAAFIPGVGPAISGAITAYNAASKMSDGVDTWTGRAGGMLGGIYDNMDWGKLIGGGISSAASAYGVYQQQEQQEGYARQTQGFNAEEAEKQRAFNADQASINRQFQERMSNTQYQRAMGDMQGAGLNPMLAFSQGGAGNVGGSQASGAAASSGAMATAYDKVAPMLNTARTMQEISNMAKQGELLEAQKSDTLASAFQRQASTQQTSVTIQEIKAHTDKLQHEARNLAEENKNISVRRELMQAQKELSQVEAKYKSGEITGQQWVNEVRRIEANIQYWKQPQAAEESIFWSDPEQAQKALRLKNVWGPMVSAGTGIVNSAAGVARLGR